MVGRIEIVCVHEQVSRQKNSSWVILKLSTGEIQTKKELLKFELYDDDTPNSSQFQKN